MGLTCPICALGTKSLDKGKGWGAREEAGIEEICKQPLGIILCPSEEELSWGNGSGMEDGPIRKLNGEGRVYVGLMVD